MQGSPSFVQFSIGANHGCGRPGAGAAHCWGDGEGGAVGDDTTAIRAAPVPVSGGLTFTWLSAGDDSSCGITATGDAYCWGNNGAGQLGTGDSVTTDIPVQVNTGVTFTTLAAGTNHACGLTAGGDAYCWGDGAFGQLGDGNFGSTSPTPIAVMGGLSFASISTGATHTCAVTAQDVAYCWGRNDQGQLGDGNTADLALPTRVIGQ